VNLLERLRYALYLAIVCGAAIGLVTMLASADVVGWLPSSAADFVFSPAFVGPLYLLAFLLAPMLSQRFPIVRKRKS
jgi:hypothetical protein